MNSDLQQNTLTQALITAHWTESSDTWTLAKLPVSLHVSHQGDTEWLSTEQSPSRGSSPSPQGCVSLGLLRTLLSLQGVSDRRLGALVGLTGHLQHTGPLLGSESQGAAPAVLAVLLQEPPAGLLALLAAPVHLPAEGPV